MKIRAVVHCAISGSYKPILDELIEAIEPITSDIFVCYGADSYDTVIDTQHKKMHVGSILDAELPTLDALIEDAKHFDGIYLYCHTKGLFSNLHQWRRNMIELTIKTPHLKRFQSLHHNMMGAYYYPVEHYRHFGGNFFWIKSEFARTLIKPTEIKRIWELNKQNSCIFTNTCNITNPRLIAEFFYGQQKGFDPLAITTCSNIVHEANLPI